MAALIDSLLIRHRKSIRVEKSLIERRKNCQSLSVEQNPDFRYEL